MSGSAGGGGAAALVSLAWRESRSTRRRLLLYMSSISLGVAALVAIDSFAANINRSVRSQSRALVGGDVSFSARQGWTPAADSLLDSLGATGVTLARETSFASMATAKAKGTTRLAQVRGVTDAYPLYGEVTTEPAGRWASLRAGRVALVDPSLLIALDVAVGDSLQLGYATFEIAGSLVNVPGDPGMAAAIGPRIYIADRHIADTRLLSFGSRADYEAFARLDAGVNAEKWLASIRPRLDSAKVRARTVSESETSLTESIDQLANFLGIVGIVALLLGGVGVASGVNAWVARKIDIVAVLRCVGATSRQVLLIYATQAALMGLVGATIGALIGIAIQFALPSLLAGTLPLDVQVQLEPMAIATGIALGVWIALAFALRPLVALRRISPLQAIRRNVNPPRAPGFDWALWTVNLFIAATLVGISATRANAPREVVGFSAGIAGVLALLLISAALLSRLARASVSAHWPYVVRQGIANLHRPANQTRSVVLSLGFGAFLVTTLYLVQSNLLAQLRITEEASRGNLLFFDVQDDQGLGVDSIVRASGIPVIQRTPIVTMRIALVNGKTPDELAPRRSADTLGEGQGGGGGRGQRQRAQGDARPAGWALRREYRSTFRDTLFTGEKLLAGRWFGATPPSDGTPVDEVSLESDIAQDLRVSLGDVITWDVQGVRIPTRLTSIREVNWARFEPNFYAVFQTRTLAQAPKTFVLLGAATNPTLTAQVQSAVVRRYPNVASIDLSLVRKTVGEISQRASLAIRFLAIFSLAMGIPVLFSAVAATRRERVREGVLLKTLGATRAQIGRILVSEYTVLGVLGSLTGLVLSFGGAWAIMRFIFDRPFTAATGQALGISAAMMAMAVLIGMLSGRDVFKETAMSALREG
ncbi:MAG: ABC transporter permease [Gemmatimonadaceae bacterium]|nr:ABC transporter permease [Gemmatimonadaceae bacterium]